MRVLRLYFGGRYVEAPAAPPMVRLKDNKGEAWWLRSLGRSLKAWMCRPSGLRISLTQPLRTVDYEVYGIDQRRALFSLC